MESIAVTTPALGEPDVNAARRAEAEALARKREAVRYCIKHVIMPAVLQEAGASKTSYIYRAQPHTGIATRDLVEELRFRYPGCKIDHIQEWDDVPPPGGPATFDLREFVKIDWS